MRDPGYKTVCDRCGLGTWYETERTCGMAIQKRCRTCHQGIDEYAPCGGTLRVIDRSALERRFASYYETGDRIRVRFGSGEEMTGTVGRTTGWRPVYLLMPRSDSVGSPWVLGPDDVPIAIKRGKKYVRTSY